MTALIKHGVLLQSAHGPLPNVAEMIAGEPIRGSWWNHPANRSIFAALNQLAESPDVVRMRLVNGKVTLVHRRLWPALVRIADRFPAKNLAVPSRRSHRRRRHRPGPRSGRWDTSPRCVGARLSPLPRTSRRSPRVTMGPR